MTKIKKLSKVKKLILLKRKRRKKEPPEPSKLFRLTDNQGRGLIDKNGLFLFVRG